MRQEPGPRFITLGPLGTNHDLVTRRYIAFRDLTEARIDYVENFLVGLEMIYACDADFMVQAAVHPDCASIIAQAHFTYGIHLVDTFISPSKPLAILTRVEVEDPKSLALQPATRDYADLSPWLEHIPVGSIVRVAEGLLAGRYDSGLTSLELAEQHPGRFRVEQDLGSVDDPWLVFGRKRIAKGNLVAWPDAPIEAALKAYR